MITLRLGFLFLRGAGPRGLARLGLIVLGTALGVWCLLGALAFPAMLHTRQDRAAARMPYGPDPGSEGYGSYYQVEYRAGGRLLRAVLVAPAEGAPVPPGVARLPAPGEAVVSPALARELARRPSLRRTFPYATAGLIAPEGLLSPDELFAYVGSRRDELPGGGHRLGRFGVPWHPDYPHVELATGDLRLVELAFLGLAGVPLAVYFAVCARLSAASRDRRLAALRLLGMSAKQTRRVNAVESVVASAAGSLLGLAAFSASQGGLARSGVAGIVWFPEDTKPSTGTLLLCLLGVPSLAAALGVVGSRAAVRDALAVRRQAPARAPRAWWLLPLVVGTGTLAGLLVAGSGRPKGAGLGNTGPLVMLAGLAAAGVGLALGFGVVAVALARAIAGRTSRLWLLLGMRRLEFEPSAAARVVAGLVVVVFGMGFANGLLRDAKAAAAPLGSVQRYQVHAAEVPQDARARLRGLPEVRGVIVRLTSLAADPAPGEPLSAEHLGVDVAFARCTDLAVFLEHPLPGCTEGVAYRVVPLDGPPGEPLPEPGTTVHFPLERAAEPATFPVVVPEGTLRLPGELLNAMPIGLLLPPERLPGRTVPDSADVLLVSSASTVAAERVSAEIAALAPAARLEFLDENLAERHRAEVLQGLLTAALLLGVLVGLVAFVVAALDRAVERRANLAALTVVGVPAGTLRAAQAAQVALPLGVGALLAVAAGKLAEQVTVTVGGYDRAWTWTGPLLGLGVGLACLLLATAATAVAVPRRIDASLIRRE